MMHKLNVVKKSWLIVFQYYPSNFKVTWLKKSSILTQIGSFQTVTPVWIHQWLWIDAQSLKKHMRGALMFPKDIHQISRSHRLKNWWFGSIWVRLLGWSQLSNPSDLPCLFMVWNSSSPGSAWFLQLSLRSALGVRDFRKMLGARWKCIAHFCYSSGSALGVRKSALECVTNDRSAWKVRNPTHFCSTRVITNDRSEVHAKDQG